jgi:hypothetical protein
MYLTDGFFVPQSPIYCAGNSEILGVPLRVGLFAAMVCLSGQTISAAIPNACQCLASVPH